MTKELKGIQNDLQYITFFGYVVKIILILLPIFFGLYVVWKYGVNVAYWDEIGEMRYMLNKEHFWTWDYLWRQHNEHRMLFPKLLFYVIGSLFSWNSRAFMFTSQVMLLLLYVLIIRLVLDKEGKIKISQLKWIDVLAIFCIGLCVYNMQQNENIFWGFQIAWFMIVTLGAWSFFYFDKYLKCEKVRYVFVSMLLAVIVSFSSLHGLAIWGGYLFIIASRLVFKERFSKRICFGVLATCVITFILYFFRWEPVSGHKFLYATSPQNVISFFLGEIGESVISYSRVVCNYVAFVFVILYVCWIIYCIVKKEYIRNSKYHGPIIMGLSSMLIISMGRGSGVLPFISSRYLTNSMLFLAFFMLVCVKIFQRRIRFTIDERNAKGKEKIEHVNRSLIFSRWIACVAGIVFVGITVLLINHNKNWKEIAISSYSSRIEAKNTLLNYQSMGINEYQKLYPVSENDIEEWKAFFDKLRIEKLNAFADV